LKRRGVLLALLSKNEESIIAPIWKRLFHNRLDMDDFAVRKINWRPKAENFAEILKACNLTPRNVVFIDDNPVEREAIVSAYPGVRAFGSNPLLWRRILLWSSETQVAQISSESAQRTELIKSQIVREESREAMPREEFLASLNVEVELHTIRSVDDPGFARALELTNKSNQFNTTGKRWTQQEIQAGFAEGLSITTFEVADRFTHYGSVGVVFVKGSEILQFLMSCRVVGLEVESAVVAKLLERIAATGADVACADLQATELNLLARDLWARCGFHLVDGVWTRELKSPLAVPVHIKVVGLEAPAKVLEPA
jgi:FkbH-like protein